MEEKERVALLLFQAKEEHSMLASQELCPTPPPLAPSERERLYSQAAYVIRIKAVTVLYFFFCRVLGGSSSNLVESLSQVVLLLLL